MRAKTGAIRPGYPAVGRSGGEAAGRWLALTVMAMLAGCTTSQDRGAMTTVLPAAPGIAVAPADLVGEWGLASYRDEADRPRTEAEARVACGNPYRIGAGSGQYRTD